MSAVTSQRGRSAAPAPASAADEGFHPGVNPWLIAVTVGMVTFMEVLDSSIANVALPHIAGSLSAGTEESTWVLTSYLVANAIVLPISGWLARIFGRKRFYMGCAAAFTLSSALCGFAPNLATLIAFRILQGLGGGGLQPSAQAILADTFPLRQRGMAFAVYGIAVVTAPAFGPTLGGWLTDNYSWRWIFFINLPVGVFSLTLSAMFLNDPPHERGGELPPGFRVDWPGLILVALGLGALQIVLDTGERKGWWDSTTVRILTITAAASLISLVIWELWTDHPVIDLRLMSDRNFASAMVLMFMLGAVLLGSTVLFPLYLQTLLGYTAMQSGLALSYGAFAMMVLMPIVGRLLTRVQARWLIALGLLVTAYGFWRLAHLSLDADFRTIALDRVIQASGLVFLFVPINTVAFAFVPPERSGNAAALLSVSRNIGGSIGISAVVTMLTRYEQTHRSVLVQHVSALGRDGEPYRRLSVELARALQAGGLDPVAAQRTSLAIVDRMIQQQSGMLGVVDNFALMTLVMLGALPIVLFLLKPVHVGQAQHHGLE